MTRLVKMVCSTCGSEDVLADAYARWNVEKQEWELTTTFDKGSVCEGICQGETSIKEVELCPHCKGEGDINDGDHPCMKCGGSGLLEPEEEDDAPTEAISARNQACQTPEEVHQSSIDHTDPGSFESSSG